MDEKNYTDREQEFEIDVPLDDNGNLKFRRGYDYLPYSQWRIKRVLKAYLNAYLKNRPVGYKGNRYPGFVERYDIVDCDTDEVLYSNLTLYAICRVFASCNIPLHDDKSKSCKNINFKAIEFMDALKERYGEEHVKDE